MNRLVNSVGWNDVISLVGLVMMGIGLWMWSPAAALTVCGGLLVVLAVVGEARRK